MRLYHLSKDCNIRYFYPRIPESRIQGENDFIPRICLTHSLGQCLRGWSSVFKNMPGGMICALYEFNIEEDEKQHLKTTSELEGLVPDAHFTREVWLTGGPIQAVTKYIIQITKAKNLFEGIPQIEYKILGSIFLNQPNSDFSEEVGVLLVD